MDLRADTIDTAVLGREKFSSTLKVLPAGLKIRLTGDTAAGETQSSITCIWEIHRHETLKTVRDDEE